MLEYMTVIEAAEKWDISTRRIQLLCAEDRIEGAVKRAGSWFLPANTKKPKDARAGRKSARKNTNDKNT